MNTLRDHDAVIGAWLDDGPRTLPTETRQAIEVAIRAGRRPSSRIAWPFGDRSLPTFMPRRLPVVLATAAAIVVATVVGLDVVVDRQGVGNPTLPTTPDAWSRSQVEPLPPHVHAITAGGPGLVAVGAHSATDNRADIWTSSDGRTWARVPGELGGGAINDVTTGGPGLVAVGHGGGTGSVWTSRDGLAWSRADDPIFTGARIEAVSTGGPGLVAVGWFNHAWSSSDGLRWELASVPPVPPDVYPGDDGGHPAVLMRDVAAAGDRLVAVGSKMLDDSSNEAVIWTSADGRTWTDAPLDREVFPRGSLVSRVIGGPDGYVITGHVITGDDPSSEHSAMWTSADGLRWTRVGSETDPFRSTQPGPDGGRVYLSSVAAGPGGYVAVGSDGPCDGLGDCTSIEAAVWTSQDARSWTRVQTGPVFLASDPSEARSRPTGAWRVVSVGSGFFVLGEYEGAQAIWISAGLDFQPTRRE